jgi:DNA-binding SARP family transcriptional activator
MTSVSLNLLRAMELERDGHPVTLPSSRKTRALLAYLAVTDRAVRRDHLCSLLWDIPDDPRGALRWSLSKLRAIIDDERTRLVADRDTVRLECSDIDIDWRRLAAVGTDDIRKIDTVALNRAAALQGELLADLELPRCDGYQAWLAAMREDVRRWQAAILRELIRRPIDPERALEVARLWVEVDPYDALARVALIDLLDRTGRRSEADAQRALGVRKLDEAAIAVPTAQRSRFLPNVPTVAESGLPGYDVPSWYALVAPAGTPQAAIARLNQAATTALRDPGVIEVLNRNGLEAMPTTPEEFARAWAAERAKWEPVIRQSGIRIEG